VGESHVESVTETIFNHVGKRSFVFVQAIEQAWPVDMVLAD
jgi:hypothetical protein